jgi:hypothetical protein
MPLKPVDLRYEAKIAAGGQEFKMKLTTTLKEQDGKWVATEAMETPMGVASDTTTLDKESLILLKREVKQGPVAIQMNVDGNHIGGTMSMNGQERPIKATLEGPLFADSAGGQLVIGVLPLAEGYSTVIRNFDIQKQKEQLMKLAVTGSEKVTVPAGSFEAFRVELTPADGSAGKVQIWIAKDTRTPVRMQAAMPQMGGATMTAELQP